jgi:hypothetical protein
MRACATLLEHSLALHSIAIPSQSRLAPTPVDATAQGLRNTFVLLHYFVFLELIHINLHLICDCLYRQKLARRTFIPALLEEIAPNNPAAIWLQRCGPHTSVQPRSLTARVAAILELSLALPVARPPLSDAHIPSPYLPRRTPGMTAI